VRLPRMGRPSPALVLAFVALFVALGGTGYAALTLPKNSVGSKQIRKGAVKTSEIANNAVTGAKVRPRSLTAVDFRVDSVPRGERGERGPAGPAGPTGPAGSARAYGYVSDTGTLDPARSKGGATVSHVAASGVYCISIPGISSASSVMSVNLDFGGSATTSPPPAGSDDIGLVEVDYAPVAPCTAGQFEVHTLAQTFDATGAHLGNAADDQPFVFIVP
jgi:hypothetical protein